MWYGCTYYYRTIFESLFCGEIETKISNYPQKSMTRDKPDSLKRKVKTHLIKTLDCIITSVYMYLYRDILWKEIELLYFDYQGFFLSPDCTAFSIFSPIFSWFLTTFPPQINLLVWDPHGLGTIRVPTSSYPKLPLLAWELYGLETFPDTTNLLPLGCPSGLESF